jgi:predicted nucleic acid-binding protein
VTVIVDSSVWIDLFTGRETDQTSALRRIIVNGHRIVVGDLVLVEVLQGTRTDRDFARMAASLSLFDVIAICESTVATKPPNYRTLRTQGITIRKTIDTLIATRCVLEGLPLLYSDRDFDPFVQHLGLRSALDLDTGVN